MKQCQNCSTKNSSNSKFCSVCGAGLDGVENALDSVDTVFSNAWDILGERAKKVGATVSVGMRTAKETMAMEKGQMKTSQFSAAPTGYTPPEHSVLQAETQPGGGWDNSVNPDDAISVKVEKYSFFQDENETTIAVLGENAAAADLKGHYHIPYAVLTQQRLYCKNEAGNFVVSTDAIQTTKDSRHNPYAWTFILAMLLPTIMPLLVFSDLLNSGGNMIAFMLSVAGCACTYYFHYRRDLPKTIIAMAVIFFSWGGIL